MLGAAGVRHVAHDGEHEIAAAEAAVADAEAVALIGPYRSRAVAEAVEVTAPAGLALLAPVATWAGVTRDDEPGCDDDPAGHGGTVLRLVARDTVVAGRIAAHVRAAGSRALVVAGRGEYGTQIDGQLRLAALPRADRAGDAGVVVVAGVPEEPGMEAAAATAPLSVIAFDGVQGLDLGAGREVRIALVYEDGAAPLPGVAEARRAAELVARALAGGAAGRAAVLAAAREPGGFDEHGDPPEPPVRLWRADAAWRLTPDDAI